MGPAADDGAPDPLLTAALAAGDPTAIAAALVDARLLVGVLAVPGEETASEGEMALALLEAASGARALPAFTSLDTLRRWRDDARPVPRAAPELAAAAVAEGLVALVVDVAGPVPWTVRDDDLGALADGYVPAGAGFATRRAEPVLHAPSWRPAPALVEAGRGVEVYALDLELPDRASGRFPALGLVVPPGSPPAALAEGLLAASDRPLDLLLLDEAHRTRAREVGHRLDG